MGTTNEKLTYLNGTKQKLKQAINNIGGEVTDETTFREYTNQLQEVYDRLPKTSYAEGSNITLSNTLKGKLDFEDDIVGYGDTSQKSTTGKNLLNPNAIIPGYVSGADGTIINSSTNNEGNIQFIPVTPNTYYTFKIFKTDWSGFGTSNWMAVAVYSSNSTSSFIERIVMNTSTQDYFVFRTNENTNYITISARGLLSSTEAQLEKHNGATDFEQYSGGYVSPSPNWEQDIEVVRGKNVLGFSNNSSKSRLGLTFTWSNSSITVNGTSTNTETVFGDGVNLNPVKVEGTYKVSGYTRNDTFFQLYWKDKNGTIKYKELKNNPTITFNEGDTLYQLFFFAAKNDILTYNNETFNLQLEKGSQATSYLPYNTVEVVERGKNILGSEIEYGGFDDSGAKIDGYSTYRNATPIQVKPNKNYIFSINGTAKNINKFYYDRNMNLISKENNVYPLITTPNNAYYLNIYKSTADGDEKWQIVEGTERNTYTLTYEPYQTPQTYQLSLGEYEFARIGNYVDTIEYDVDEDKVYKNEKIGRNDFDENLGYENFSAYWGQGSFGIRLTNIGTDKIAWSDMLCKYFVAYTSSETKNLNNEMVVGTSSMIFNNPNISTLIEWITWVTTHHFSVFYPKSTSTLIEITDTTLKTQVKALYNSHSFTGTTIIEIDGQLPLIIKVRALKGE